MARRPCPATFCLRQILVSSRSPLLIRSDKMFGAVFFWCGSFGMFNNCSSLSSVIRCLQVNGVFMQETFSVASSDDRVMIQKRNRLLQTHKKKMKRFFNLADKSKNGSIDMDPGDFYGIEHAMFFFFFFLCPFFSSKITVVNLFVFAFLEILGRVQENDGAQGGLCLVGLDGTGCIGSKETIQFD